jgi:hypothetical protein
MIVIKLESGTARNQLQGLSKLIEHPREILAAGAVAGRRALQRHFSEKDKAGNKLGGARTHFWGDVGSSTQLGEVSDRQANIDIGDSRFAQRLYGGPIRAKRPWPGSGFLLLTIPVNPLAYGRRASVMQRETGIKLSFVGSARGGVLGHFAAHASEDEVYYVCVPEVTQPADPSALPPDDELEQTIVDAAQGQLSAEAQALEQQAQAAANTPIKA